MATKKPDFSSRFGIVEEQDIKEEKSIKGLQDKIIIEEKIDELKVNQEIIEKKEIQVNTNDKNMVITYNNPMKNLEVKYKHVLEVIKEEENNALKGFIKKIPQSEIYANVTIQVRRDLYSCICEYINDMRMGKTKVLNEIFMLGINEFINKYSINND